MKTISLFLCICVYIVAPIYSEQLNISTQGEAAILMNAETGAILFEKNANTPLYPASTTKIATALYTLTFHKDKLDTFISAPQDALATVTHEAKRKANYSLPAYWLEPDGTHIGLKKDEELTLLDLLKGTLIASGNDAANVIAQATEESVPQFMGKLNDFLKEVGCQQTTFYNPHGLHHPQHQTTAYDLAMMTKQALKDKVFCDIVSQTRFNRPKTNKQQPTTMLQTNRLLRQGKFYYPKAIGVKTGYHSKAKKNFVGAARWHDRTLIVVLMKYDDRNQMFQDAIKLFDTAFNQPKIRHVFLKTGSQKFSQQLPQADKPLTTYLKEEVALDYYPAEDPQPKCLLYWDPLRLPIAKDQPVGRLQLISQNGTMLKEASLFAVEQVHFVWPHRWLWSAKELYKEHSTLIVVCGLIIFACLGAVFIRRLKS